MWPDIVPKAKLSFSSGSGKYTNRKPACNIIFEVHNNVCPIYYHVRDIISQNVHDIDLYKRPRSNTNMPIAKPHAFCCAGNSNVCSICHRLHGNHMNYPCIRFTSLALKMKDKDVDDLDENLLGQHILSTYVRLQKLVLLGLDVCTRYIMVHFMKY